MTFPFVSLKRGGFGDWEVGRFYWCATGSLAGASHTNTVRHSSVINVCGTHAAVCHRRTAVAGGWGEGGCYLKKRNSFTASLLQLILLHFLRVKPVGPDRKTLYPNGEMLLHSASV